MSYLEDKSTVVGLIKHGSEISVVVQDPTNGAMLWMRGRTESDEDNKLLSIRPSQREMYFKRTPTLSHMLYRPEYELRIKLPLRTFSYGFPADHQLMRDIPIEYDPTYFQVPL